MLFKIVSNNQVKLLHISDLKVTFKNML